MCVRFHKVSTPSARSFQPATGTKNPILVALATVAIATLVRLLLDPLLEDHAPYVFFAIAIVIAALYGGKTAGIAATVLCIPLCDYLFISPRFTWFIYDGLADSIMMALFGVLGIATTFIIAGLHENRKRLRQSLVDLHRTEFQLERLDENLPEPVFTATEAGEAEHLNGFFGKYSGLDSHNLLGRGWLDLIHPEDRTSFLAELAAPEGEAVQFEKIIRLRRSDAAYRMFKCHATRKPGPNDHRTTWFGVCSDIQNEQTLAAALKSRTQELTQLNQSLERFAYTASHDLQEPLRTISTFTELYLSRKGSEIDAESSEILGSVIRGAERMKRLIGDIMDLAKTANATAATNATEVDMRAVAEFAIANLAHAIRESGASIVLGELPKIHAHEGSMLRLFQNLIGNAIKFRSGKLPEIHISADWKDGQYLFAIRDNGIGIEPEDRDKVFEPFRRLHERSQYDGSGLGLAACARIVQALNGRIWVESSLGQGTTFFFTIPKPK